MVYVCVHMMQCIIFGAFTVLMIRFESCQGIGFPNLITFPLIILTLFHAMHLHVLCVLWPPTLWHCLGSSTCSYHMEGCPSVCSPALDVSRFFSTTSPCIEAILMQNTKVSTLPSMVP